MEDDAEIAAADSTERITVQSLPEQWAGFSNVWRKGYQYIYTIRLVRGRLPEDQKVTGHWPSLVRWLLLAYGPGALTLIALFVYRPWWPTLNRLILIVELGTINAGAFAAAALAWGFALKRTSGIDDVLRKCSNRDKIVGVIGRAVDHRRQAVLPIIFAALPWIIAFMHDEFSGQRVVPFVLLLLNITWSMMLIANDSYWLIVPPLIAIRMTRSREMELRWNDPAYTPGIRVLSTGYAYPAFFLALAAPIMSFCCRNVDPVRLSLAFPVMPSSRSGSRYMIESRPLRHSRSARRRSYSTRPPLSAPLRASC